ncbi:MULTISPECIES: NAD(P)-dependent oxidoreductase [Peribacillus]|uniref:NAD(P)-dependent oxidoreductase n=1 Tax=Peribacillus castrilensis TaxID=2897690 RepID=A0AAW9N388_9BACI|nr:NAD(P)-dependent oxidoreductase [Peribacillus frigoritolerans]MEC0272236.1 NAD(P)-dependent oxidoreductase [Peribacillus castrilensis]MEB2494372.1 NAD(P)-dependent oxidoreductase [Peribacillus frigoritolerans]MEC0347208.1 NAD(P)-dependent oxidoreductase [Peribacillus castrilensis]TFH59791.1 NAD(P)-dependent oxidoreductase [Peribacillus frigoritolerans]WHY13542.1 NAD(P)-dependent oxidoreductase [Peribacillus frigoritolerans]
MKIGIIGASGKAGSLILKEALTRGHEVTAIVRDEARVQIQGASVLEKDVFDLKAEDIKEFDVVVNAFGAAPGKEHLHVDAGKILIEAMKGAPQTKLIVVGGAGSLFVDEAKTIRVLDTPEFPKEYFATAFNQSKNLGDLQNATDIQWTFISPSAFFDPQGNRTGGYKLGKDNLLVNSKGESYVSYADFALAVLDEIENPQHINQRFTVVAEAE